MKKTNIALFSLLCLSIASCGFEEMPFDKYDQEFIFSTDVKAEGYVLSVYTGLPYDKTNENGYNRVDGAMLSSATDESAHTVPGSTIIYLTQGSLTSRNANPDGCWEDNYMFIRDALIGLEGIDELPDSDEDLKVQLRAELKFLQAWYYFELVKRYGGVPILDHPYELSEDLNVPRSSFADCINHIVTLCDEASQGLP